MVGDGERRFCRTRVVSLPCVASFISQAETTRASCEQTTGTRRLGLGLAWRGLYVAGERTTCMLEPRLGLRNPGGGCRPRAGKRHECSPAWLGLAGKSRETDCGRLASRSRVSVVKELASPCELGELEKRRCWYRDVLSDYFLSLIDAFKRRLRRHAGCSKHFAPNFSGWNSLSTVQLSAESYIVGGRARWRLLPRN